MAVQLYKHNQETYENILEMFKSENRVGVVQPTGTGKSFLFLKWIEYNPDDTFILLSPSNEIFTQIKKYALEADDTELLLNVQMITYQTLNRMSEDEIECLYADKIIIDEFHRVGADQWNQSVGVLLDTHPYAEVLGATATPIRYLDGAEDMSQKLFDSKLARYMTLGEAVRERILPEPTYVPVWYDWDDRLVLYQNDIDKVKDPAEQKKLQDILNEIKNHLERSYGVEKIFKKYMTSKNGKYIVFCKDIGHIDICKGLMTEWLCDININVNMYQSTTDDNDKNKQIQMFREDNNPNAIKLLFVVDRLNEGVHVRDIDGVIMLRPTESPIIYLQQMGRALASRGKKPLIFDIVNNYDNVKIKLPTGERINVFEREFKEPKERGTLVPEFKIFDQMTEFTEIVRSLEEKLWFSRDKAWMEWYELYKEFKEEFNKEPKTDEIYKGRYLGDWVCSQRSRYKSNTLSDEKYILLENAGFTFEYAREQTWNYNLEILKQFLIDNHRFPFQTETYNEIAIGNWCYRQRQYYTQNKLAPYKESILRDLGMDFETRQDKISKIWNEKFKMLSNYKNITGKFPTEETVVNGVRLGAWLNAQRTAYNKDKLNPEYITALKSIEALSDKKFKQRITWSDNFKLVVQFKNDKGYLPRTSDTLNNINIGVWLSNQRSRYIRNILSEDKIVALKSIGALPEVKSEHIKFTWDDYIHTLLEFYQLNGEFPKQKDKLNGIAIGEWYSRQKYLFNKGDLSQERIETLQRINAIDGFSYQENLDRNWNIKFELLTQFKEKHGIFPRKDTIIDNIKLGNWYHEQRSLAKRGLLNIERKMALQSIGVQFSEDTEIKHKLPWNENLKLLMQFKETNGFFPKYKDTLNGVNIGFWYKRQLFAINQGTLSIERINALQEIGAIPDKDKNILTWEDAFNMLKDFKDINGYFPKSREIFNNINLGKWYSRQLYKNNKNKLKPERKKALQEIGALPPDYPKPTKPKSESTSATAYFS